MAQLWELLPQRTVSGEIIVGQHMAQPDGTIPADVTYTPTGPKTMISLKARGMTYSETIAEEAKWGTSATFTTNDAQTVTGYVSNVASEGQAGLGLYDVTITLIVPYAGTA